MILDIKKEGDPILRQPTDKVTDFGFEFQKLVDDMIETMRTTGMGLAAPQVGISKKLFVAEFTPEKDSDVEGFPLAVLANPEIIETSKNTVSMVEGCLSVPNREIIVRRPRKVTVAGQDRYGNNIRIEADKLLARTILHENDHLNCTLIIDYIKQNKVIFIGTGSLGTKALEALLLDSQYKVVAVITGEKKAQIRGQKIEANPIFKIAERAKVPIIRTERIRDKTIIDKIKRLKPDVGVMADFGQIIPDELLQIPRHGVINIHPSLLPRHRGSSPIQQTILDGDKVTGLTLMQTTTEMDAGPIIAQAVVELSGSETYKILKGYFIGLAGTFLLETLPYYLTGELKPVPQDQTQATCSRMFKFEDGFVDSNTMAKIVERKIRAFSDWPKVYTVIKNKKVQLLASHFNEQGEFLIDRVKPEGKKAMSYSDFLNGYHTKLTFKP